MCVNERSLISFRGGYDPRQRAAKVDLQKKELDKVENYNII